MIRWTQRGWTFWSGDRTDAYLEVSHAHSMREGYYVFTATLTRHRDGKWLKDEWRKQVPLPYAEPYNSVASNFVREAKQWAEDVLLSPLEQLADAAD